MARTDAQSLRDCVEGGAPERFFWDSAEGACTNHLARGTSLGGRLGELAGRSVLLATSRQLATALALIELDGVARRITILPPDAQSEHLPVLAARAEVDAIVVDDGAAPAGAPDVALRVMCSTTIKPFAAQPAVRTPSEWVLLTSGTTGVPKMVVHSLAGLTAAIKRDRLGDTPVVWGTFYDIRRYGGLQIFLRAVLGGASLVLSSAGEPIADHLGRLARCGVTHLTGTPSHWRRALMSPAIRKISPRYVRLSGEIADQAVLDSLRAAFPEAAIGHAYASTEAGVAFEVTDGLAGFPAAYLDHDPNGVEMKVADGSLRIRSSRAATRYLGADQPPLADPDGYVDTGDIIERHGDRYVFVGRAGGIINIGGLKVHPEEVEAVINRHPQVRMALVRSQPSPITGAVAVAEVVLKSAGQDAGELAAVKNDILKLCGEALPRHKVPAVISVVPALNVAASGKLMRRSG